MSIERERNTSATRRRVENLRRLVEHLRVVEEMTADDMCAFLVFSPSGTRKYIKDMRMCGVLVIDRFENGNEHWPGLAFFRLTSDETRITEFLATIGPNSMPNDTPRAERVERKKVDKFKGRNIHVMADDTQFMPTLPSLACPGRDYLTSLLFQRPSHAETSTSTEGDSTTSE